MQKRQLGNSKIDVSAIGLGAMPLSYGSRPSEADAIRVIHASLGAGVDLIDTADAYCEGESDIGHNERLIAKALRAWKGSDRIVVATKGGLERPQGRWTVNGHPKHLRWACEQSLKALEVEAITLYQWHRPDPRYPLADSVGELARLRREGKIRHVGLSNVSVAQIREAQAIVPIVSVQNCCSPFERMPFNDGVLAHCESEGIAMLAYSPVGGWGKARVADDPVLNAVGTRHGVSPFQVALAWLLAKSRVMIPIPGASKILSAIDSARACQLKLEPEDMRELDATFPT